MREIIAANARFILAEKHRLQSEKERASRSEEDCTRSSHVLSTFTPSTGRTLSSYNGSRNNIQQVIASETAVKSLPSIKTMSSRSFASSNISSKRTSLKTPTLVASNERERISVRSRSIRSRESRIEDQKSCDETLSSSTRLSHLSLPFSESTACDAVSTSSAQLSNFSRSSRHSATTSYFTIGDDAENDRIHQIEDALQLERKSRRKVEKALKLIQARQNILLETLAGVEKGTSQDGDNVNGANRKARKELQVLQNILSDLQPLMRQDPFAIAAETDLCNFVNLYKREANT